MHDKFKDVVAFRRRVLRVASGILIEPCPVDEKGVGGPAVGDQAFEDIAQHLLHGQIDADVGGEDEAVLVLQAEDPLFHGAGGHHSSSYQNTHQHGLLQLNVENDNELV